MSRPGWALVTLALSLPIRLAQAPEAAAQPPPGEALPASADDLPEGDADLPPVDPGGGDLVIRRRPPPPQEPGWRQILSVPRVGGRIWSLTVDPRDPDRIFVGTQAGSLMVTDDGGSTWREIDVDARVIPERSATVHPPGLPKLGKVTKNNFRYYADPPGRKVVDRISVSSAANPFPIKPDFFWAGFLAKTKQRGLNILSHAGRGRVWKTQPIKRIALCPGGRYEVLVASSDAVYGSQDGGLTYVRLFANAGRVFLDHAICSPADPNAIAVATNIGLFLSNDGGLTFDQDLTAWPGKKATAVAFSPPRYPGEVFLFSAAGSELFAGDPTKPEGLTNIYPTSPRTAPWRKIRWITADAEGGIYLATDDGARVSFDRGKTWKVVARTLTSRQAVGQMEVGEAPDGHKRIAVLINVRPRSFKGKPVSMLHDSIVYASDDGGETFFPFFAGYSMRTYRQMAAVAKTEDHPAGWWVATSGGVWTNYPRAPRIAPDREAARWARARIAATPPIDQVIEEVLTETHLSTEKLRDLGRRWASTGMIPKLELQINAWTDRRANLRSGSGPQVGNRRAVVERVRDDPYERDHLRILLQLTWKTYRVTYDTELLGSNRRRLHRMRRQIELAAQDAWHERMSLLSDLALGEHNPMEAASIKARIESLEAILALWMRHPFPGADAAPERNPT